MDFLRFLEGIRTPFLDAFFQFVTFFGQEMLILAIICLVYWCLNKKLAYEIGLSFFTAGMLLQNLKITFRVPRPWILDPNFKAVPSAIPAATGYSFPSGHTQSASSLFSSLAFALKKTSLKILFIAIFLFVGFSRMYLGVHTPKDVGAAMVLGVGISFLCHKLFHQLKNTRKSNLMISVFLAIVSLFTAVYSLVLLNNGTIEAAYAADCCKASGAGLGFALAWYVERCYINFNTDASLKNHTLKFIFGISSALLLKGILKALTGDNIPAEMLQYFILVFWIIAVCPILFLKFKFSTKETDAS